MRIMPEAKQFKLVIGLWTRQKGYAGDDWFFDEQTHWFDTAAEAFEWLKSRSFEPEEVRLYDPEDNLIHSKG
jgi:hypothetical protein